MLYIFLFISSFQYASELANFRATLLANQVHFEDLKVWDLKGNILLFFLIFIKI